jgi:DNA-directed RNA polymerase specialized sigma24 family protein
MRSNLKVTYRDIAKMLASALPIEAEEFTAKVETNLNAILSLSTEAKIALKSAYIFSRKVPRQEREDLFQDLALAVLKAHTKDEKLAYAIARCDWRDWWKKYKIRQHYSLDTVIEDEDGNPSILAELVIGEVDFEKRIDGEVDAERIWNMLPPNLKITVRKRLLGQMISPFEAEELRQWAGKHAMYLV